MFYIKESSGRNYARYQVACECQHRFEFHECETFEDIFLIGCPKCSKTLYLHDMCSLTSEEWLNLIEKENPNRTDRITAEDSKKAQMYKRTKKQDDENEKLNGKPYDCGRKNQ